MHLVLLLGAGLAALVAAGKFNPISLSSSRLFSRASFPGGGGGGYGGGGGGGGCGCNIMYKSCAPKVISARIRAISSCGRLFRHR